MSESIKLSDIVKLSDIIAGTIAMLIALLYITPDSPWFGRKVALIIVALVGLSAGWYSARERHWMMKIFLYAGIMVLCILVADLSFQLIQKLG